jgi:hypothetical protein
MPTFSLPLLLSLPHSFCSRPTSLPDIPPAKMPKAGTLCSPFNCFRSCLGITATLAIQRFGTSQSLPQSLPIPSTYGIFTAGERASLREKRESIEFPLSQSLSRPCGQRTKLWLDRATIRFRFIGPNSCYTGSNSLLRPVLSSPAHALISLDMR